MICNDVQKLIDYAIKKELITNDDILMNCCPTAARSYSPPETISVMIMILLRLPILTAPPYLKLLKSLD